MENNFFLLWEVSWVASPVPWEMWESHAGIKQCYILLQRIQIFVCFEFSCRVHLLFFLFPNIVRVRFFFKYPKTWLNATFPLALLCQHCCWKCRHFQALFGLNDIGRQQSDQTICFSSGWLCNCSFSTVSHSKSAERKNITRNANAGQVAPSPLMSWFKFLSFLSGIVKCVTKSLNLSQCLCLLVPLLWSIVRKVPCVNSSSTVLWRLWNRKCQ